MYTAKEHQNSLSELSWERAYEPMAPSPGPEIPRIGFSLYHGIITRENLEANFPN